LVHYTCKTGINLPKRVKEHKTNCEKAKVDESAVGKRACTHDHRIKWDEANILAMDSKIRESFEIKKHNTIDQEGNPLDSTCIPNPNSLMCKIY
jgi:hypothetical protein